MLDWKFYLLWALSLVLATTGLVSILAAYN